jgi:hypothetical protein
MKFPKPAFYLVIALALAALLYVIYSYQNTVDGFVNKDLIAHFQNMSNEQKGMVCGTFKSQITEYKTQLNSANPEQKVSILSDISNLEKTASSYGC